MNKPITFHSPNTFLQRKTKYRAWQYLLCIIAWMAFGPTFSQVVYTGPFDNVSQANSNGFTLSIFNSTVFPDNTVQAAYGDGNGGTALSNVYLHGSGEVFDPKSLMYDNHITKYNPYIVDAVSIAYKYNYVYEAGAAPDTLIFQFYAGCGAGIDSGTFKANTTTGFPKEVYAFPLYDYINNQGFNEVGEYKYILGSQDATGSTFNFISVPTNGSIGISVKANDLFAYTVSYRPGFTYQPRDTIDELWTPTPTNLHSHFRVLVGQSKSKGNDGYEESLSITQNRYNNMPGWNGRYIPGNAWNNYDEILWSEFHTIVRNVQNDAGLEYFASPEIGLTKHYCEGESVSVIIMLSNTWGYADLTSATISWQANGVNQKDFQWHGKIVQSTMDTTTIGYITLPKGDITIKAWVHNPNSTVDSLPCNDTAIVVFYANPAPHVHFTVMPITSNILLFTPGYAKSYSWNFGDGIFSGAESPSHHYAASGTYTVTLSTTDILSCSGSYDSTITIAPSAIAELSCSRFNCTAYPNPFTDGFTLAYELTEPATVAVELFDAMGTRVLLIPKGIQASGAYRIDISSEEYHINSGIYQLKLSVGDASVSKQIIKL